MSGGSRLARLKAGLEGRLRRELERVEARSREALARRPDTELSAADEPPVIARLVVEIRSDGARTIARGAIEDARNDERVTLQASARSPAQLAAQLVRRLFALPLDGPSRASQELDQEAIGSEARVEARPQRESPSALASSSTSDACTPGSTRS